MKLSQRLALKYIRTRLKLLSSISKKKAAGKAFELFCTPQQRNKKALTKIFEQAESLHFKIEGTTVRGWRWNYPSEKKVLILHGFESTVVNFEKYFKHLIAKGYEILAFDAPAHGRSDGKQINAPLYKKFIQETYKRFGPIRSFIAHSFGGLAVCLALEEITHTKDNKVVLVAPATETTTSIDGFFKILRLDQATRIEFDKIIFNASGVPPGWYSIRRAMKNIHAKVLWLQDEDDDITPLSDVLKVKAENHPNIEFVITKGLGHRRIYRDNKVVKTIIDFL